MLTMEEDFSQEQSMNIWKEIKRIAKQYNIVVWLSKANPVRLGNSDKVQQIDPKVSVDRTSTCC